MSALLDRDDLAQIKAIARWKAEESYDPTSHIPERAWVATKVKQAGIDALRKETGHRNLTRPPKILSLRDSHDRPRNDGALDTVELRDEVRRALAPLPAHHRALMAERYLLGLTCVEIGRRRGLSPKAVEGTIWRAERHLRRTMALEEST